MNIHIYVYMKTQTKLTSVKIIKSLYENFRSKTVNSSMNLQKIVNRSIHQYLNDVIVREQMESYDKLLQVGVNFNG